MLAVFSVLGGGHFSARRGGMPLSGGDSIRREWAMLGGERCGDFGRGRQQRWKTADSGNSSGIKTLVVS